MQVCCQWGCMSLHSHWLTVTNGSPLALQCVAGTFCWLGPSLQITICASEQVHSRAIYICSVLNDIDSEYP